MPQGHAHVRRAAGFMLFTELEPSTLAHSRSYAATPALKATLPWPRVGARLTQRHYEPRFVPLAEGGRDHGQGMTEKHGGSDVRANTRRSA